MKKRLIYILTVALLVVNMLGCTASEEKETEAPLKDVNSLLDKYVQDESNSETTRVADNSGSNEDPDDIVDNPVTNNTTANDPVVNTTEQATTKSPEQVTTEPPSQNDSTTGIQWEINGSTLIITGTGKMSSVPWYNKASTISNVVIASSITNICDSAFADFGKLTAIQVPTSITSIGYKAFYQCTQLSFIIIPSSVTEIGDFCFTNCSSITDITIPGSVNSIGYNAFADCTNLNTVKIEDGVTKIGSYAFSNCGNLQSKYLVALQKSARTYSSTVHQQYTVQPAHTYKAMQKNIT